jgi:hypothetical protein
MSKRGVVSYLVVPPISACSNLLTTLQPVGPAKEVAAQIREVLRSSIVQANNEQSLVHDIEARLVVLVPHENLPEVPPVLALLCRQNADRVTCDLGDVECVGIRDDSSEVALDLAFSKQRSILVVENVEPISKI